MIKNNQLLNIQIIFFFISVIRVTDFSPNGQREDKFRIHLYEHHSLKSDFLGTKEISSYLHPTGKNQDKQSVSNLELFFFCSKWLMISVFFFWYADETSYAIFFNMWRILLFFQFSYSLVLKVLNMRMVSDFFSADLKHSYVCFLCFRNQHRGQQNDQIQKKWMKFFTNKEEVSIFIIHFPKLFVHYMTYSFQLFTITDHSD